MTTLRGPPSSPSRTRLVKTHRIGGSSLVVLWSGRQHRCSLRVLPSAPLALPAPAHQPSTKRVRSARSPLRRTTTGVGSVTTTASAATTTGGRGTSGTTTASTAGSTSTGTLTSAAVTLANSSAGRPLWGRPACFSLSPRGASEFGQARSLVGNLAALSRCTDRPAWRPPGRQVPEPDSGCVCRRTDLVRARPQARAHARTCCDHVRGKCKSCLPRRYGCPLSRWCGRRSLHRLPAGWGYRPRPHCHRGFDGGRSALRSWRPATRWLSSAARGRTPGAVWAAKGRWGTWRAEQDPGRRSTTDG